MTTSAIVLGLNELAKTLLIAYFTLSRMAGKTAEEIEAELKVEREKFATNKPENIPG